MNYKLLFELSLKLEDDHFKIVKEWILRRRIVLPFVPFVGLKLNGLEIRPCDKIVWNDEEFCVSNILKVRLNDPVNDPERLVRMHESQGWYVAKHLDFSSKN